MRFLFVVLIVMATLAGFSSSESTFTRKPQLGFFHFGKYSVLDGQTVLGMPVRVAINWGDFEPEPGKYLWNESNDGAAKIDDLLSKGFRIVPSLRVRSPWAVAGGGKSGCDYPPSDLNRKKPLGEGVSYSASWYRFVTNIARRYAGNLDLVVIGNEMNDGTDMACMPVDDYLRIFLTAKKALKDVSPSVQIADGGIQGFHLAWTFIKRLLQKKEIDMAISFHSNAFGLTLSSDELESELERVAAKDDFLRTQELVQSGLFNWADRVNFHYYQRAAGIPMFVKFLREVIPVGKPLLTNEIGLKAKLLGVDPSSADLIKKVTTLLALGVGPVVWFSPDGELDNNAGAFVRSSGELVAENIYAFEAAARYVGREPLSIKDLSTTRLVKYRFVSDNRTADVLWGPMGTVRVDLKAGCKAIDHQNNPILNVSINVGSSPVFVLCPRQ